VAETEDYFGTAEDFLAHGANWLTFSSGSTVEFFHSRFNLPKLLKKFPKLAAHRSSVRLATHCEYAAPDATFAADDEIALIPPVSGG
jgi:molybdopterin converting factor small subunit